jgi:hypothetical protein
MAQIIHRCDVCSSEILASASLPAPQVCLLCQLSAEEALSAVAEQEVSYSRRMLPSVRGDGPTGRILRLA